MRKISGNVVWERPISLSRAAKLLSRFSAVDNGSSAAVSMYLERASEAFNHLVKFHSKRVKMDHLEENPEGPRRGIPPIDSETGYKKKPTVDNGDGVVQIALKNEQKQEQEQEQEQRKKKKNKKRKNTEVETKRKKRGIEGVDS